MGHLPACICSMVLWMFVLVRTRKRKRVRRLFYTILTYREVYSLSMILFVCVLFGFRDGNVRIPALQSHPVIRIRNKINNTNRHIFWFFFFHRHICTTLKIQYKKIPHIYIFTNSFGISHHRMSVFAHSSRLWSKANPGSHAYKTRNTIWAFAILVFSALYLDQS